VTTAPQGCDLIHPALEAVIDRARSVGRSARTRGQAKLGVVLALAFITGRSSAR
jgi:hypothetical protein